MKPFLILQLRPEPEASDNEFEAFLEKGQLAPDEVHRIRLERDALPSDLDLDAYSGVIVGGGPGCVSDPPEKKTPDEARIEAAVLSLMPRITDADIPFLGCCYGIGILGHHLGAPVGQGRYGEPVGPVTCTREADDPLLDGLPERFDALVGHKEAIEALPEGLVRLLGSAPCPNQMVRYGRNVYATQFHPEADGNVFALRIRIYRNKGYFDPEEADALTERCSSAEIRWPAEILRNFVKLYRRD